MDKVLEAPITKQEVHKVLLQCYEQWEESLRDHDGFNSQFQVTVLQEVPPDAKRTAAAVTVQWWGVLYTDVGFATLNRKSGDVWNSEYGADMAIRKAIANLAKQIALEKPPAIVVTRG